MVYKFSVMFQIVGESRPDDSFFTYKGDDYGHREDYFEAPGRSAAHSIAKRLANDYAKQYAIQLRYSISMLDHPYCSSMKLSKKYSRQI